VEVRAVVPGEGSHKRWEYARATITPGVAPGGADSAPPEDVVIRRRSGKSWKQPRPGEEVEVQVWSDPDPTATSFAEPGSGARLFSLRDGSLADEVARWSASGNRW
jgi:hypothetical protein